MITTTIWGGLGNQMFMYAAVRAASLRNNAKMAFNLRQGFEDDKKLFQRSLELEHFNIVLPTDKLSSFDYAFGKYVKFISRKVGFNILNPFQKFIRESGNVDIVNTPVKAAYIEGYWGNERYFADYADEIRKDFSIKEGHVSADAIREYEYMRSLGVNIVMVGVRRYQECTKVSQIPQGAEKADAEYFKRAMKTASQTINNPVFYVFSQDQQWFKDNVDDGTYNVYYAKEKEGPLSTIDDMYLMTHCDHFIISYSTYYWWAAWLGTNPNKKVYSLDIDNYGCKQWIKI